ncbi:MAG: hypothetical protein ABEJ65_06600 [bacterium]
MSEKYHSELISVLKDCIDRHETQPGNEFLRECMQDPTVQDLLQKIVQGEQSTEEMGSSQELIEELQDRIKEIQSLYNNSNS